MPSDDPAPAPLVPADAKTGADVLIDAIEDYVARAVAPLHKRIIEIETKAAGAPDLRAKLDERERQATRHAEHLQRVETRITQIIARIERLESGRRE